MLDRSLPVVHSDDVCRALAEPDSSVRVLMLTAGAEIDDRVAGLALARPAGTRFGPVNAVPCGSPGRWLPRLASSA
jgi:hypothetical protein